MAKKAGVPTTSKPGRAYAWPPDWRRAGDYPDPESLSLQGWAFQFLIRNPVFVAEFKTAREEFERLKAAGQEWPAGWAQRPHGKVLKRWGVAWPRALPGIPNIENEPYSFEVAPRSGDHATISSHRVVLFAERDDRLALEFDLDGPIEPQLERARLRLLTNQRSKFPKFRRTKVQVQKFPLYLRILDAMNGGASPKEMLVVLQLESRRIDVSGLRKARARALKLRDGGYRRLVSH